MSSLSPSLGRARPRTPLSGAIRDAGAGVWQGLTVGPRGIGAEVLGVVGTRIPGIEVSEDVLNDAGVMDTGDDGHEDAAAGTLARVDVIDLLNQPGLVALPRLVHR